MGWPTGLGLAARATWLGYLALLPGYSAWIDTWILDLATWLG
uniref:Uncharacterized protein n=2 Tax=Picea TaxID=3328 RepID=A0A101M219_PICGL|nr:hypothetical protein ABT39_MTgene4019 [Picea glauca]QHR89713.1 hypothetical protein Q903MT_gene3735 [Picea sitchensis]